LNPPTDKAGSSTPTSRNPTLDVFRGYAVAGMIAVNFLGGYACTPRILKHTNDYCSYADTIMPHFLFAVGFAIAVVSRRFDPTQPAQVRALQWKLARRCLALMAFAFVLYFPWTTANLLEKVSTSGFWFAVWKRDWMQTLTHIAWTTLWMLPCIAWSWRWRWMWLTISVLAHAILSEWIYFHWVHASPSGIDGGPLGFLTWSIPAWTGWWAGDLYLHRGKPPSESIPQNTTSIRQRWLLVATALMVIGYGASCLTRRYDRDPEVPSAKTKLADSPVLGRPLPEGAIASSSWRERFAEPPFVPPPASTNRAWNYWQMSQRAGTLSYLVFASGFSLLVFALFEAIVSRLGIGFGILNALGRNALICYAAHGYAILWLGRWLTKEAPAWQVALGLLALELAMVGLAMLLHARRIYIRM